MTSTARQILAAALCGLSDALAAAPAAPAAQACHEDDPCFRWSQHGNLQRGIVTTGGRRLVVSPCRFAALDFHGRIDWKRTPRLRGDGFARAHGCDPYLYA